MASEVKSFLITGGAAASYTGLAQKPKQKGRRATVKKQEGGAPVIHVQGVESQSTQVAGSTNPSTWLHLTKVGSAPITPSTPMPTPSTPIPPITTTVLQQGGTRQIKVELKKKTTAKKVHLQPKKADLSSSKKHLTRKIRKVSIGISSLHKRITRAKKVHTTIKAMPLDKLREHLIQKKLIKATSKAPESILRQIAADSQIVAGKSL
uniref:Uncharacterized protein n=1 Tax=viral metagenome TaxID=1070528 RepID=A0A6C0IH24_9ZZZZ